MSPDLRQVYSLILELNKLKGVLRNNTTVDERRESSAEHSWSVAMICLTLMPELKREFPEIDEAKVVKLALIHDVVEIYAGDVIFSDTKGREAQQDKEEVAIEKLSELSPEFGSQIKELWSEFEARSSIEARIANGADAICPMFLRLEVGQSYKSFGITVETLEQKKLPKFEFSETFSKLYEQLKTDLLAGDLI